MDMEINPNNRATNAQRFRDGVWSRRKIGRLFKRISLPKCGV